MKRLEYEEFLALAKNGNVIPVYATYLADLLTPVSAFLRLQSISKRSFLLESVEGGEKTARFSFLGCNPYATIRFENDVLSEERDGKTETCSGNIFDYLKSRFEQYQPVRPAGLPRFTGGAVGYFGYETIRLLEKIPVHEKDDLQAPDALLMLFDTVLAFDHLTHQIYIISNVFVEEDDEPLKVKYNKAVQKIEGIQTILARDVRMTVVNGVNGQPILSNSTPSEFCQAVLKAQEHIKSGEIFQVVLSQKFQKEIGVAPFDVYRALRVINPSPYLYFLSVGDFCIIGSSPELLVRVEAGTVDVRPIAGTRPRGKSADEDRRLMQELSRDEKEVAEHVMLVDLGRNDVGRVAEYGTVEVSEFMTIEKYSHVMHMVSNVRGQLRSGLGAVDALKACFPAGTVSGAPKIRAMEIITELEPARRGIYAGALGYLDFSGNLDTCIVIRTIITKGNRAYFQAGAGIVADSVPEKEYRETVNKAEVLRSAIEFAERGLR